MPSFRYRAVRSDGRATSGVLEGVSRDFVLRKLRRDGLTPISADETSGAKTAAKFASPPISALANTMSELAVLLDAGLALDRALAVCVENCGQTGLKTMLDGVAEKVRQGVRLSQALAELGPALPPLVAPMVEAGEANGRLADAVTRLAESLERADALRRTLVTSMIYPTILLAVTVGVISVMFLFVVPQFESVFTDPNVHLPEATRLVLSTSRAFRRFGGWVLLGLTGTVLAGGAASRRPGVRLVLDRLALRTPMLGPILVKTEVARFSRVLGSLIDGGLPVPAALTIARRSIGNSHMSAQIATVAQGLRRGGGLTPPLAATELFPPIAISFLRTGEETARLGPMLMRLADVLDRDLRVSLERLINILSPAITLGLAAMVATIIASIISGILGFNDLALPS